MATIAHIWIPVSNLNRSVEFYGVLGFKKKILVPKSTDIRLSGGFAHLTSQDKSLLIILVEKPEVLPPRGEMVIGFKVNNLSKSLQTLKKARIPLFGNKNQMNDRVYISLLDPDTHILQLTEMK